MKNIPVRHIHSGQQEPGFFSGNFNIRQVENILAGKKMVQELHRHDYFYVLVLKKGKGSHEIDFTPYKVNDNTIFFMRPGQVHQLTLNPGSTGYLMVFDRSFYFPDNKTAVELLRRVSAKNSCLSDAKKIKKLVEILTSIFQEYSDKKEAYEEVIKANLGIFFIELIRRRQNRISSSTTSTPYIQERLEEFLELLEIHISAHKQVAEYAEMLNVSAYQLNAITKTALGKTCSKLINDYILLESKRYLLATSNQVSQIAYLLGYEDVSYFIRFFKKNTGYTPEVFRQNFK